MAGGFRSGAPALIPLERAVSRSAYGCRSNSAPDGCVAPGDGTISRRLRARRQELAQLTSPMRDALRRASGPLCLRSGRPSKCGLARTRPTTCRSRADGTLSRDDAGHQHDRCPAHRRERPGRHWRHEPPSGVGSADQVGTDLVERQSCCLGLSRTRSGGAAGSSAPARVSERGRTDRRDGYALRHRQRRPVRRTRRRRRRVILPRTHGGPCLDRRPP